MPPIAALVPLIGNILDRIFPDEQKANEAKLELAKLQASGELALLQGQIETNKTEAGHASRFVAGWRPFIGWVCGFALMYEYLLLPLFAWASLNFNWQQPPHLAMDGMLELVLAMLGVAGLRTFEKYKGVA